MAGFDTILNDPEWLPHRLDAAAQAIIFAHVPRELHRSITFLEDQYIGNVERRSVPVGAISGAPRVAGGPVHFIFHSAFAGSTLMARCFDLPGVAMGLKEPIILNDLANAKRGGALPQSLTQLVSDLLARPFAPGEAVVVKPSNYANNLIGDLMSCRAEARALLLYSPLADFLRSVGGKGLWGRRWARRLCWLLMQESPVNLGYSQAELFELTDLQVAGLAWLHHHVQFASLTKAGSERFGILDTASFLGRPAEALDAVGRLFGLPVDGEAVAHGPAFATHSKKVGESFDAAARATEHAGVDQSNGEEIQMVERWIGSVAGHVGVSLELRGRLLG